MALRCVRVATFTLVVIGFALLMGQPIAHAQTPTPTPKPGHGPLSLEPHSAPVAGCIAKCQSIAKGSVGDFLACLAGCRPKPTRKPTNTERPTRTPIAPVCCQCGNTDFPSCFGTTSPEGCSPIGSISCVAKPGRECFEGHCVPVPPTLPPTPTSTPCIHINCV